MGVDIATRGMTPAEVRAARKRLGLTQAGLGEVFEVSGRTVCQWEQEPPVPGRSIPAGTALALRYMLLYGLPDTALKASSLSR